MYINLETLVPSVMWVSWNGSFVWELNPSMCKHALLPNYDNVKHMS